MILAPWNAIFLHQLRITFGVANDFSTLKRQFLHQVHITFGVANDFSTFGSHFGRLAGSGPKLPQNDRLGAIFADWPALGQNDPKTTVWEPFWPTGPSVWPKAIGSTFFFFSCRTHICVAKSYRIPLFSRVERTYVWPKAIGSPLFSHVERTSVWPKAIGSPFFLV